ncbi:MAG: PAS domain S-box protein [Pelotomaculum sp.]|nr:PAS domain S-box protein [Pelotomaculum sp.]
MVYENGIKEQPTKLYENILNSLPSGVYIVRGGKFQYVSPKFQKITGYGAGELLGRDATSLVFPEDREKVRKYAISMLRGKEKFPYEFRIVTKSGEIRWFQEQVAPITYRGEKAVLGNCVDITGPKKMESDLRIYENRLRQITGNIFDIVSIVNKDGIYEYISPSAKIITGHEPEEIIGTQIFELVHPDDLEKVKAAYDHAVETRSAGKVEYRYRHADGHYIWFETTGSLTFDEEGQITGAIFIARDITERKRAEENLCAANRQLVDIIEFLPDPTFVIDCNRRVIAWNRAIEELTGVRKEEILGKGDYVYAVPFYGKPRPILIDLVFEVDMETERQYEYVKRDDMTIFAEVFIKSMYKKERGVHLWGKASPLFDSEGNLIGAIESIRDITERKQVEKQLMYLSLHDSLTGLYNRAYFEEEMRRAGEGRYDSVGIIICDVDDLKIVNDTLGHDAGDALLIAAARVIKESFREGDMVARIGGDEFAVLLPESDYKVLEDACCRIRGAIARYNAENPGLPLSISIGFAARSGIPKSMSDLFKEADNKMYREKLYRSRNAQNFAFQTLKKALGARDFIYDGHTERLQSLVTEMARAISLPENKIADLRLLAQFHDIGKVGIPDSILFKPGALDPEEYMEMQRHCEIGHLIAMSPPDLNHIADLILKHHEWWNGKGYPLGLKGEDIPLECRILTIADAYDAMTSDRPYRKAMTHEEAVSELKRCAGTQFDPYLVDKFLELLERKRKEQ